MEAKTLEERTIAAQKMVRLETERLGIPGIPLYVKETGSSNCVALYNNEENEIWYAPEHLTSQTAEEFLRNLRRMLSWNGVLSAGANGLEFGNGEYCLF